MAIGGNYMVFNDLILGSVPTLNFPNQEIFNNCANFFRVRCASREFECFPRPMGHVFVFGDEGDLSTLQHYKHGKGVDVLVEN